MKNTNLIPRQANFVKWPGPQNRKFGLVATLGCAVAVIWAGCTTQQQQRGAATDWPPETAQPEPARSHHGGRHFLGGTQQQQQQQQRHREEPVAEVAAPEPQASANEDTIKTDLVTLQKRAPASAALDETFEYQLQYTAHENLDSLVITDHLGEGVVYVRSEPAATVEGQTLTWTLRDLAKGQSGSITVGVKADREGTLENCATLVAVPKICVTTFVGKAVIGITKTGPEQAVINHDVDYSIMVTNHGSLPARDVVVTDTLPEGLSHESGQPTLTFNVGELAPNTGKQIAVTLKATAKGRHCNTAQVTTANAGKAESEVCTTVLVPGVHIVKTGDKEQFLTRTAKYRIVVSNTGETPLTDVVVTDTAPSPTSIASAEGADVSGNKATWHVGGLEPGQDQSFEVTLTCTAAGNYCNSATVVSAEGLSESAEACTDWRGVSALLLEKADNPDPIQVGENTTYTVKVTNQGTADDTNVKVVVEFPEEIDPVSASHDGVVSGKTVTFPPFPRLAPKQAFEYSIVAKGVKVGDARVKFIRTSDEIPNPTTAEESTRVY